MAKTKPTVKPKLLWKLYGGDLNKIAKRVKRSVSTVRRWKREGVPKSATALVAKVVAREAARIERTKKTRGSKRTERTQRTKRAEKKKAGAKRPVVKKPVAKRPVIKKPVARRPAPPKNRRLLALEAKLAKAKKEAGRLKRELAAQKKRPRPSRTEKREKLGLAPKEKPAGQKLESVQTAKTVERRLAERERKLAEREHVLAAREREFEAEEELLGEVAEALDEEREAIQNENLSNLEPAAGFFGEKRSKEKAREELFRAIKEVAVDLGGGTKQEKWLARKMWWDSGELLRIKVEELMAEAEVGSREVRDALFSPKAIHV